jgi:two-component system response regulator HydG
MDYLQPESGGFDSAALIAGTSAPMRALGRAIGPVAASDVDLLVQGERGTGRRAVAQAVHRHSSRKDAPLFTIACGNRSAADIEEELLGVCNEGVLLAADRGATLYLHDVACLSASLQASLLRALRVTAPGRLRIIASTEAGLNQLTRAGRFLNELYAQLAPICLTIPPLRERREDIPDIVMEYLRTSQESVGADQVMLDPSALAELTAYSWPGNARELHEMLAVVLAQRPRGVVSAARIRAVLRSRPHEHAAPGVVPLDEFEHAYIIRVLGRCNGNKSLAARQLGIGRNTMSRMVKSLELDGVADSSKRHGATPAARLVPHYDPAVASRRALSSGGRAPSAERL